MNRYDADQAPDAADWLAANDDERLDEVRAYHRRLRAKMPNERAHAMFHMIVENQLATSVASVVETLERLQREGLDRHDAVHAIGKVLAEHIYHIVKDQKSSPGTDLKEPYFEALRHLTAEDFRHAGS